MPSAKNRIPAQPFPPAREEFLVRPSRPSPPIVFKTIESESDISNVDVVDSEVADSDVADSDISNLDDFQPKAAELPRVKASQPKRKKNPTADAIGVGVARVLSWFSEHVHFTVSAGIHLVFIGLLMFWVLPRAAERPPALVSIEDEAHGTVIDGEQFGNALDGMANQTIELTEQPNPLAGGGQGQFDPGAVGLGMGSGGGQGGGEGEGIGTGKEPGINFFGTAAEGSKFVFIVDSSGSMDEPARGERGATRWHRAISELNKSLGKLKPHQKFYVYFFSDITIKMYEDDPRMNGKTGTAAKGLQTATPAAKSKAQRWVKRIQPRGMTNPEEALSEALAMKPDVIFLMTDGEFEDPDELIMRINKDNTHKVVIHTVAFDNDAGGPVLEAIAKQNGGIYRFVR